MKPQNMKSRESQGSRDGSQSRQGLLEVLQLLLTLLVSEHDGACRLRDESVRRVRYRNYISPW